MARAITEPVDAHQVETLTRQVVRVMMQAEPQGLATLVSLPFWEGAWKQELTNFRPAQFDGPAPLPVSPDELDVQLRFYPLGDLAALRPEVWQSLKASAPEHLLGLHVAVAGLTFKADGRTDAIILLLRRVEGQWRVAGLMEAR